MRVATQRSPFMDSMNLTVIPLGPRQTIVSAVMPQRSEPLLEEVFESLLKGNSSDQKQHVSGLMLRSLSDFALAPQQSSKQNDSWKAAVWRSRIAHMTGDYSEHPDTDISFLDSRSQGLTPMVPLPSLRTPTGPRRPAKRLAEHHGLLLDLPGAPSRSQRVAAGCPASFSGPLLPAPGAALVAVRYRYLATAPCSAVAAAE